MRKIAKRPRKYLGSLLRTIRQRLRRSRYAEWRDSQLAAEPAINVSLRHGAGRNLVLGLATGYDLPALLPFVRSLRRFTNCRAMLVMHDESVARQLDLERIDTAIVVPEAGYVPHINFARAGILHRVLLALAGQIDWVFFLDTRDVVFQADPFEATPPADIVFFKESRGSTFKTSNRNRNWLIGTFGEKWLPLLGNQELLCGGTILAKYEAAVLLCKLKLLLGTLVADERHSAPGVDQMTTNMIARLGLIPRFTAMSHDQLVATLSQANRDFLVAADGDLFLNRSGKLPAIIHQYDRVPEVQKTILNRYTSAGNETR
jgi:hypothetical protein